MAAASTTASGDLRRGIARRMVQVVLTTALWAVLFFVAAGRLDAPRGWTYVAASVVLLVVNFVVMLRANPEVIAARSRLRAGTKAFDKVFALLFGLLLAAMPVVAGLDAVRYGWAPLPFWTLWPGLALLLAGNVVIAWAMAVNRHLETTVRIQEDRGHRVIMAGPYRIVRHPMYVGVILQHLSIPLILGTSWAYVPVAAAAVTLVIRTALEDRTLQRELAGYEELVARTRYRLVPGVW